MNKSREEVGSLVFLFGLLLMAVGLPLSKFLMSISQFVMAAGWFYSGDVKNKFKKFFKNKPALLTASVLLIHVLGLLYTSDMQYGWEDVRKKIPLLVYPVLLASWPRLSAKNFNAVLLVFVSSVLIGTLISMAVLAGIINKPVNDIRDISIFISHIRFSLLICIAVIICVWYFTISNKAIYRIFTLTLSLWFFAFLIILESITGLVILLFIAFASYGYYVFRKTRGYKTIVHALALLLISLPLYLYIKNQVSDYYSGANVKISELETHTANGRPYVHNKINRQKENGNYVWHYLCEEEVRREWPVRCGTPVDGVDGKNNPMMLTIYRYLTSKNLRKDSAGVHALSGEDIILIEQGVTNYRYKEMSDISARIYRIIWEIDNYIINNNPSGHSVTQRVEFWKAALGIIKENLLLGVGTGDAKIAFALQYEKTNSYLSPEWRLRSHNQFLAIAVALGAIGLLWFSIALFYPFVLACKCKNYLYVLFFMVMFLSMLTEDTLETQAGVSFYIFFHCLFFYAKPEEG